MRDPDGDYPKCKPALWSRVCERCNYRIGSPVTRGACPAVPKSQRRSIDYEEGSTDA
jgi:hypothetical protein